MVRYGQIFDYLTNQVGGHSKTKKREFLDWAIFISHLGYLSNNKHHACGICFGNYFLYEILKIMHYQWVNEKLAIICSASEKSS